MGLTRLSQLTAESTTCKAAIQGWDSVTFSDIALFHSFLHQTTWEKEQPLNIMEH